MFVVVVAAAAVFFFFCFFLGGGGGGWGWAAGACTRAHVSVGGGGRTRYLRKTILKQLYY